MKYILMWLIYAVVVLFVGTLVCVIFEEILNHFRGN